ncbi:hypothetical protein NCCP2716_19670 [Sporosarcina sp. NCCP-2716]|nr:hypothetical protein NCCP2716_19670 [Sporosarcina sp. NCCP-2716]
MPERLFFVFFFHEKKATFYVLDTEKAVRKRMWALFPDRKVTALNKYTIETVYKKTIDKGKKRVYYSNNDY